MTIRLILTALFLLLATGGSLASPRPVPGDDQVRFVLDGTIKDPPPKRPSAARPAVREHQFLRLEFRSEVRVERYLRTAIRRYLLGDAYAPAECMDTSGATSHHCFTRTTLEAVDNEPPVTTVETLELELHEHPSGGFELYFFGTEDNGAKKSSKLKGMIGRFATLLSELKTAKLGGPNDEFFLYSLSYVQADRAVAVLKTLGYSVIEYSSKAETNVTTAVPDKIYASKGSTLSRPAIINMIDPDATSLVEKQAGASSLGGTTENRPKASVLTGGQRLDAVTDGVPLQQLLIVYDKDDRPALYQLLKTLNEEIDVAAKQILIEALVVELDRDKLKDIGIQLRASEDGGTLEAREEDGIVEPLLLQIVRPSPQTLFEFDLRIRALVDDGTASVLSRPSVLVLDGRQARIKVGDEVPFTSQVAVAGSGLTTTNTAFLSTGIILNLRPRASADDSQVTFQVETIISSAGPSRVQPETGILIAPVIQSRQVQTLVRVANDTPFVIGGLIDRGVQEDLSKVPVLSKVWGLGRLFRKKTFVKQDKEVIVVITPHIIPVEDDDSSFVIPRDSDLLDNFGSRLFRDSYRLRQSDIFDLEFIKANPEYKNTSDEVRSVVKRGIALTELDKAPPLDRSAIVQEVLSALEELKENVPEFSRHLDEASLKERRKTILELQEALSSLDGSEKIEALPHALELEIGEDDGDPTLALWSLAERLESEKRSIDAWLEFAAFLDLERRGQRNWPTESEVETLITFYNGDIPGEEILVQRMLIGLLEGPCPSSVPEKLRSKKVEDRQPAKPCEIGQGIPLGRIIYLQEEDSSLDVAFLNDLWNGCSKDETAFIRFGRQPKVLKQPPVPVARCGPLTGKYVNALKKGKALALNDTFDGRRGWNPLQMLRSVLALERTLDLNPEETFPRTMSAFHVGREVILPTQEDLSTRTHLLDRQTARLYYETLHYYDAFYGRFRERTAGLQLVMPVFRVIPEQEFLLGRSAADRSASRASPAAGAEVAANVVVRVDYASPGGGPRPSEPATDLERLEQRLVIALKARRPASGGQR